MLNRLSSLLFGLALALMLPISAAKAQLINTETPTLENIPAAIPPTPAPTPSSGGGSGYDISEEETDPDEPVGTPPASGGTPIPTPENDEELPPLVGGETPTPTPDDDGSASGSEDVTPPDIQESPIKP